MLRLDVVPVKNDKRGFMVFHGNSILGRGTKDETLTTRYIGLLNMASSSHKMKLTGRYVFTSVNQFIRLVEGTITKVVGETIHVELPSSKVWAFRYREKLNVERGIRYE